MSKYPYRDLGTGFDRNFRNDLNANFDDVEADLRDIRNDIDAKDSAAQARMTQIENDSIERDNGLDARIDNIVANAGNSNTEIVDARYDSINNVTHPTLRDRLDDTSNKIGILSKQDDKFLGRSLFGSMLDGKESLVIQVLGDSTGNEDTEWVYLLAQKMKEQYPNYNIKYSVYDNTNSRYPTFRDIGTPGTERSLRYNGSGYIYQLERSHVPLTSQNLDVRIKLSLDNWASGTNRTLISRYGPSGKRGWRLKINTSNLLLFEWSEDGTNLKSKGYTTNVSSFTNGQPIWLRVTLNCFDTTLNTFVVTFYKSDDGITWTQLSTHTDTSGASTSIFNADWDYEIGGYSNNGEVISGNIYDVQICDGINGDDVCPKPIDAWRPNLFHDETEWAGYFVGNPTLYIYNGSIPGYGIEGYSDFSLVRKMVKNSFYPLIFVSISHNDRSYRNDTYYTKLKALTDKLKTYCYEPNIIFLTQNPRISPALYINEHAKRRRLIMDFAKKNGFSFIDTYYEFLKDNRGVAALVNSDGIHPNQYGSQLWCDTVWDYLKII